MKRILITGISGFVGTGLLEYFSKAKDIVILGFSRNAETAELISKKYEVIFISELNAEELDKNRIDCIIHLAGIAHDLSGKFKEEDYRKANTDFTKTLYDAFAESKASTFVFVSSVKALVDHTDETINEDFKAIPKSPYGKSKRLAEEYLLDPQAAGKFTYILRPCMIHGPRNKGNLNLLYKFVRSGIPYPLAAFENKRSFLSLENFCFVTSKIIRGKLMPGVYMLSDTDTVSTNELIDIIAAELNKKARKLQVPKSLIRGLASIGSVFRLPFNTQTVAKLCENMVIDNSKLLSNLNEDLPITAVDGLKNTIRSFNE